MYVKKCPICGEKLECDDIEFNFVGNQNEYSTCNKCHISFIFYIRYSHLWKYDMTEMYFDENDNCWYCPCETKYTKTIFVYKKGSYEK